MNFVKTTGRFFDIDKVVCALVDAKLTTVCLVDHHDLMLTGDDAQRMNRTLRDAGFVGEGTLINPNRIILATEQGDLLRLTLEGNKRIVYLSREAFYRLVNGTIPAQETPVAEKPRKKAAK